MSTLIVNERLKEFSATEWFQVENQKETSIEVSFFAPAPGGAEEGGPVQGAKKFPPPFHQKKEVDLERPFEP